MLLAYTITHLRENSQNRVPLGMPQESAHHTDFLRFECKFRNGSENFPACLLTCKGAGETSFPKAAQNVIKKKLRM